MPSAAAPLVSVCLPAFNNARFIEAAIRSVLEQTLDDFELIIVDDRSSDGTREKIRAFSDPRIRLVENERNLGHEGNWNKALGEARGRFVKILPGDDILYPSCLERQIVVFEACAGGEIALACCGRDILDECGRKIMRRAFPGPVRTIPGPEAVRICVRAGTNLIGEPAAVLIRADLVSRTGKFNGENLYVIDLDYWTRLLFHGKLAVMPESLCGFRVSRAAVSTRIRSTQSRDFCAFLDRLVRESRFSLKPAEVRRGKRRARLNAWLRRLFYRMAFPAS